MFFSSLCSSVTEKTNDNDAKELIDQFDTLIKALEMQIRKKKHECEEHKLKATNLYVVDMNNNKDEALMEMRIRADKQKKYKEWLGLLENLHRVRNQVDCSTPYVDIIDTFKEATKHLKKFDLDDIEDTLQTLNDITSNNNNIIFDDTTLMKELNDNNNNIEEEEEEIYLPSVPVRKIEQKIKILV